MKAPKNPAETVMALLSVLRAELVDMINLDRFSLSSPFLGLRRFAARRSELNVFFVVFTTYLL